MKQMILAATILAAAAQAGPADTAYSARAARVLTATPLIDGHNDLPYALRARFGVGDMASADVAAGGAALKPPLHTDMARLREGRVGAQFWSVYVPATLAPADAVQQTVEQIEAVHTLVARYPATLELATTAADIRRIHKAGRVASLIGIEGGHQIGGSLAVLRGFHRSGARYMTLTQSKTTDWCDSATDAPRHDGLSDFGLKVVAEMNRLGMLVDLSHISPAAMEDALRTSRAPVIFSHSSARALVDHPRNVPDSVLRQLSANGGVAMVTFVPSFVSTAVYDWGLAKEAEKTRADKRYPGDPARAAKALKDWEAANPAPQATLAQVADHIEHVRRVAGVDHVGIGSDFDGIETTPQGLDGVEDFPALFAELARRGWSDADLAKLAGGNLLRVLARAEAVAAAESKRQPR